MINQNLMTEHTLAQYQANIVFLFGKIALNLMYPSFRPGYYIKLIINEATRYFRKIDFWRSGMSDL